MLWLLSVLLLCCCVMRADALEGKPLYDYMIMFMENNWNVEMYQKAIQSILDSPQWKTLDAQYGPWTPPAQKRGEIKKK